MPFPMVVPAGSLLPPLTPACTPPSPSKFPRFLFPTMHTPGHATWHCFWVHGHGQFRHSRHPALWHFLAFAPKMAFYLVPIPSGSGQSPAVPTLPPPTPTEKDFKCLPISRQSSNPIISLGTGPSSPYAVFWLAVSTVRCSPT